MQGQNINLSEVQNIGLSEFILFYFLRMQRKDHRSPEWVYSRQLYSCNTFIKQQITCLDSEAILVPKALCLSRIFSIVKGDDSSDLWWRNPTTVSKELYMFVFKVHVCHYSGWVKTFQGNILISAGHYHNMNTLSFCRNLIKAYWEHFLTIHIIYTCIH